MLCIIGNGINKDIIMLATMEQAQQLTTQINALSLEIYRLSVQLYNLEVDRIYNGRSTQHIECSLMHRIYQSDKARHSLRTQRGMALKMMRDNQLSLIG